MFDFVHENKRLVQIVLALIILPFAFWGVDSYQKSGAGDYLASVEGEKISTQEFDMALRQQQQKMREMAGPTFDQSIFDKPEVKQSILDSLVTRRLLQRQAIKSGLVVTDEQLASIISGIGEFQTDGKFDKERFKVEVASRNMDPLTFEALLRQDLVVRQLTDAYIQNAAMGTSTLDKLIGLNEQQRVVALARLDMNTFFNQVSVTDEQVDNYYKKNQNEFKTHERARVEYVLLSLADLESRMTVSDAEVEKFYQEHQNEFSVQEQRQAAHILITVNAQASDADKQLAKTKAEQILQQLKKSPNSFAALAKQYSQDPGSAANGGDLGMFGRGSMVKPFEDAVFKLKVGEISQLVQSDYGFHIIKLSGIKSAKNQSLQEVKVQISQRIKNQKAADKFAELSGKFGDTVYEQSDSLKPAAALINSEIQQGGWIALGQTASGMWTNKVLQAVFSEDVIKNKRNTSAIEISPNTLLSVRVLEHQPASVKPQSEVASVIRKKLEQQQASDLMAKQGQELLSRLQKGESVALTWKTAQNVSRMQHPEIDLELAKQIFKSSTVKLPAYVGAQSPQGQFVFARIDAVKELQSIDDVKRNGYAQQIKQLLGNELLQAYLVDARKHADITLKAFAVGK